MKTLILSIAIAFTFASCSTEPNIDMRAVNPTHGINESAKLFFEYSQGKVVTKNEGKALHISYDNITNVLSIGMDKYQAQNVSNTAIIYDNNKVITFNTGYVWQDGKTRTKFDLGTIGSEDKTIYVYNN